MAKDQPVEKFIQKAIKRPGAFTAKAKKAKMGVQGYAAKVLKPGSKATTRTKRQAVLARTLSRLSKRKGKS